MGWARLYGLFDWFVPAALRSDQNPHRRARMFVIAHLLGTPLGFPIVAYLYWLDPGPQSAAPAIGAMIGAFLLYPPLLRLTRQFVFLALLSGQHLSWIVLFTAYNYGGVGSPFLAPEHLESVLVPFGQVDSAFNRSVEGTGLGLPLSKRLIELHGGVLSIESRVDHGTTVTIRLPAERAVKQVA